MSVIIKAHFDGRTIVPDAQIDLPADQALEVELRLLPAACKLSSASEAARDGKPNITSLPFFGMWADREDMADSAAWVRKEREKWSSRLSGTD